MTVAVDHEKPARYQEALSFRGWMGRLLDAFTEKQRLVVQMMRRLLRRICRHADILREKGGDAVMAQK